MALCDSMYPRKLIFCYLQDLHKEFVKLEDVGLTESIMRPYSFVKFGNYIPVAAINYRKIGILLILDGRFLMMIY